MHLLKRAILFIIIFTGCIEPYEFVVKNNAPALVVEAYLSNVSYNESIEYPSEGRYFTVELRYTGDVINIRDEVASNASVKLIDDSGEEWSYVESSSEPGKYILNDKDFKAVLDQAYKLQIDLSNGESYESHWEKLPDVTPAPIGNIGFEETTKQVYRVQAGENVLRTVKGINVYIELPQNETGSPLFYRWDFTPLWIYIAPLAPIQQWDKKCWTTSKYYLSSYALQIDNVGDYRKNLFFMETERNERIFEQFSVLIRQQAMSENFYYFWKEMQEQTEGSRLFDKPPYNLQTNIKPLNSDKSVVGYFGVVDEKAKRWYFNIKDLSYNIKNTLREDCLVVYGPGPPAPACLSCLEYQNGEFTTTDKPSWWKD